MELLKHCIREKGTVVSSGVLKVDAFLNHQLDVSLLNEMGKAFYAHFGHKGITKILTIEASGIAIAVIAAQYFNVPVVFAKKAQSLNLAGDLLTSQVYSFTKQRSYDVMVSKRFLTAEDNVLILDDFLAEGSACRGLMEICHKAGATLGGVGIAVEKGFQQGGQLLRQEGVDLLSLAVIEAMSPEQGIAFGVTQQF